MRASSGSGYPIQLGKIREVRVVEKRWILSGGLRMFDAARIFIERGGSHGHGAWSVKVRGRDVVVLRLTR